MPGWMEKVTRRNPKSGKQARDRLRLVLIHDRTDLNPDTLDAMKNELIDVISRYVAIDPATVRIDMAQEGREQRLIADIPIKGTSSRRTVG